MDRRQQPGTYIGRGDPLGVSADRTPYQGIRQRSSNDLKVLQCRSLLYGIQEGLDQVVEHSGCVHRCADEPGNGVPGSVVREGLTAIVPQQQVRDAAVSSIAQDCRRNVGRKAGCRAKERPVNKNGEAGLVTSTTQTGRGSRAFACGQGRTVVQSCPRIGF